MDRPTAGAISRAMEQAGIRPSQKSRRVGDQVLGQLLFDSPTGTYQHWEASNSTFTKTIRRVRIYSVAAGALAVDRETIPACQLKILMERSCDSGWLTRMLCGLRAR